MNNQFENFKILNNFFSRYLLSHHSLVPPFLFFCRSEGRAWEWGYLKSENVSNFKVIKAAIWPKLTQLLQFCSKVDCNFTCPTKYWQCYPDEDWMLGDWKFSSRVLPRNLLPMVHNYFNRQIWTALSIHCYWVGSQVSNCCGQDLGSDPNGTLTQI